MSIKKNRRIVVASGVYYRTAVFLVEGQWKAIRTGTRDTAITAIAALWRAGGEAGRPGGALGGGMQARLESGSNRQKPW